MGLTPFDTYAVTAFLAVALSIFGRKMYVRLRYLFAAKAKERRWDHLPTRLKNFIVYGIFQRKVAREWYAGVLHSFIFWAFVILGASVVEITAQAYAPSWRVPTPTFAGFSLSGPLYLAEEVIALLAAIGVGMALYRRYVIRPKKLMHEGMRDATIVLCFILGIVVSFLLFNAADATVGTVALPEWKPISSAIASTSIFHADPTLWWRTLWWTHVVLLFSFLAYVPHSKHIHIIFAIVNTFFMDLTPRGALKTIDLEKTETFGVNRVEQLSWRQLLDGYACTECGRCTAACPANATGKPLNPMQIITNMRDTLNEQGGAIMRQAVDGLPDMFQTVHSDEGIWACTTCYACVYECPVMNEHVPKIIEMRRHMVLTQGEMPPETREAMRNIEQNFNPWGIGWDQRARWAEGLGIPTMAEANAAQGIEVLYWVGCAASFDDRNRKVAQAFARILRKAGVRFAILGPEEKCTGDPPRRLGNEYLAQTMIMGNVETLNRYAVTRIVATCPHCFNTLKNEYPDFGGRYDVVHHSQFLRELIDAGRLTPTKDVLQFLTYHDACYLGRYNQIFDEPREVLYRIPGVRVVEMEKSRDRGFCCGAGGARMWMEERGEKVNHRRLSHIEETHANAVATACPYCLIMLDDAAKTKNREDNRRYDIAELLDRSL